jgi:hypothetical protein
MRVKSCVGFFRYSAALICCCLILMTVLIGYVDSASDIPVANAGRGQTVTTRQTVHLDGSNSTDLGGGPLTYH